MLKYKNKFDVFPPTLGAVLETLEFADTCSNRTVDSSCGWTTMHLSCYFLF